MQDSSDALERLRRGRQAFSQNAWREAFAELSAADQLRPVPTEDIQRLGIVAGLLGEAEQCNELLTRAHYEYLAAGETQRAVRCSFWVGLGLMMLDEPAQSSGWLSRSRRLLDDASLDCVERGYLLIPEALRAYWTGDVKAGHDYFVQAVAFGERFQEPDLLALGRMGLGEALIHMGQAATGLALMDEAMASVTSGGVSPMMVGLVYCAVLACCQQIYDLGRAREWTAAFSRWYESQPDLVMFRGDCIVHRAELMQLRGAWPSAVEEAQRACERLSEPGSRSWAGSAYYRQAEVHRLLGEYDKAEEAYRLTSQWGASPQPGLALLRLAQGSTAAAVAASLRSLAETQDGVARSRLLPAHVEIMLAAREVAQAQIAAEEMERIAGGIGAPFLRALSAQAMGAVCLAKGEAAAALVLLRNASNTWDALETPYETARARVLIAQACRELGDEDGAELELSAARQVFQQLGAAPDLAALARATATASAKPGGGLTERELEVLRLIASGKTNRAVAEDLVLSDHTVRRHLQNIFAKLGVSTRSAATAYAFQHGLV